MTRQQAIPVTAMSGCNALGRSLAEIEAQLFAGNCGLVAAPAWLGVSTVVGAVHGDLPQLPESLALDNSRQARMCMASIAELLPSVQRACQKWTPERVAIVVGTSTGGVADSERANMFYQQHGRLPDDYEIEKQHGLHATLKVCRALSGCRGPGYIVSTACSSSAKVFATALRLIRQGFADAVVAGGVDTLCRLTVRGFASLEVLSAEACRPLSSERKGINIGEGGAFALLEREGESIGRIFSVGESSDAHHMTAPHPDGNGARQAMQSALDQAGLVASDLDHVNAHATATLQNDRAESAALSQLSPTSMHVVANKGAVGHMLGAAGATELMFSLMGLARAQRPPSVGVDPIDPSLQVLAQSHVSDMKREFVLSNSLAFGGSNVSILVGGKK